jgi:hypothetical protein
MVNHVGRLSPGSNRWLKSIGYRRPHPAATDWDIRVNQMRNNRPSVTLESVRQLLFGDTVGSPCKRRTKSIPQFAE